MSERSGPEQPSAAVASGGAGDEAPTDYGGAVYGSMLAASVVAGAGSFGPFPRFELVVLLLCTGLVFWAAHVFARIFGARVVHRNLNRRSVVRVCLHEWPIAQAALPPALAVAVSPLLGLGITATAWFALGVAVLGQVGWAVVASVRGGAPARLVVVIAVVNLVLGLVIVGAKAALSH